MPASIRNLLLWLHKFTERLHSLSGHKGLAIDDEEILPLSSTRGYGQSEI